MKSPILVNCLSVGLSTLLSSCLACSERDLPSRWTAVGLSTLQICRPHSLWLQITARFCVLSTCTCWIQGCCWRQWRGRPFWWASQSLACCHPPLRSSPRDPWPPSLRPHPVCNMPDHPMSRCTGRQSVRMKSLQAKEWPADLIPVHFNCRHSTA